ncbi:flagellar basal body protein, partial [Rhizobium ruizarguesonis]
MSVSGITITALSGMRAQTTRVSAIANNIANSSTPGYARLNTSFTSVASGGAQAVV